MNKNTRRKIYRTAIEVRKWAEDFQKDRPSTYTKHLQGLCAIATARLHRELQKQQIPTKIVLGSGHVFLVAGRHVVDVTATQFYYLANSRPIPKVLICRWEALHQYAPWEECGCFTSVTDLINTQFGLQWPTQEIPDMALGI